MTKSIIDDRDPERAPGADQHVDRDGERSTEARAMQGEDRPQNRAPDPAPRQAEDAGRKTVPPPPRKRVFVAALLLLVALLAYGGFKHWQTNERAVEAQQEAIDFVPDVQTITAKADDSPIKLTLPGETQAFDTATIFPRATGYVAERRVDIGSRVRTGDVLIRIASPDLDQQLAQAQAQLQQSSAALGQSQAQLSQAKANLALANVTFNRTNQLTQRGYETVQNNDNQRTQVQSQQASVDTAQAGIKVAEANVKAQQATVDRLHALTQFEEVRAPFDGIITTRGIDKGDLVNADTKTGSPLFTVAKDSVLRVTVHVPQADAFAIREGLIGEVRLPQMADKVFNGRIARSSVALLNSARTLDTEVDVANPDGELKPGAFVNVSFSIPRDKPNVVLPAEALIFNQNGLQVAVVQDDQVRMQKVTIYRDFGKTVELRDGLNGGEQVVVNAPTDLADNAKVKVKAPPPQEQARK